MFRLLGSRSHQTIRSRTKIIPKVNLTHAHVPLQTQRFYSRSNPFYRAQRTYQYFKSNPRVLALVLGSGTLFYVANLEKTPGSGRWRFNWIPASYEIELSQYELDSILQQYRDQILPDDSPEARLAHKVIERLLPHTGVQDQGSWEVRVIRDPTVNAFVMPGNKVFVFTGMLDMTQNEDGLAAVLGHEIAHNIAHHTGENMSRRTLILPLMLATMFLFDASAQFSRLFLDLLIQAPGSRRQESEADYLGLLIMARSCYDPEEAVRYWERMSTYEKALAQSGQSYAPPQFLSTHPSTPNRLQNLRKWLPEAIAQSEASDCTQTRIYSNAFLDTWRNQAQNDDYHD